ncbi:MAG: ABC transporter ATP-binding protein [Mojavia pulchra JT2-VF2]|jgi:lipopolysaccharide transport system ATP-binding protein|uniref:ABC transporter ATP-binding protein n=1 Tax=Mojavia pulchra JT2-VF2 TaxID=287848 RepID=A0A951PVI7_9NOST|nr:ABC transporter ATP-binding protein [Mojavia pulchra JT2-VF2]
MTIINEKAIVAPQSSESDIVLSANGVSKKFCRDLKRSLMYGVQDITSELLGLREKSDKLRKKEFWALDNVSFELRRGEALGLVGKNGSGKSTLLRIIAGLIKPDAGCVEVNGRVAPLIALGAGFNPILTGRENIYANMSILGLSKKEIDERFDEVIDFAEIGDAIDAPVQSYSSGMAARLGFASAIHTEPDILLIDEVLAVGDVKFRAKCERRLHELRRKGTSFVLVSHQPSAILNVCDTAIYLSNGQLIASSDSFSIISQYEEDLFFGDMKKAVGMMTFPEKNVIESTGVDIVSLFFRDEDGNIIETPVTGEPCIFCVGYNSYVEIDNAGLNFTIQEVGGESNHVLRISSFQDKQLLKILPGKHEIQVRMPYLGIKPGSYTMTLNIRKDSLYIFDIVESFKFSVVANKPMSYCLFYQPRTWEVVSN